MRIALPITQDEDLQQATAGAHWIAQSLWKSVPRLFHLSRFLATCSTGAELDVAWLGKADDGDGGPRAVTSRHPVYFISISQPADQQYINDKSPLGQHFLSSSPFSASTSPHSRPTITMVHHTALLTLPVFLSLSTATARIHHSRGEHASHDHAVSRSLPKRWFHTEDSHPVHKLFNRQEDKTDGQTYAAVGSPGKQTLLSHLVALVCPQGTFIRPSNPLVIGCQITDLPSGFPEWTALFPPEIPDASQMPQEWKDALKAAEDAGLIPDIPVTTLDANGGQPTYPAGIDPAGDEVCNWGYECKHPDDIWNGLDGYFGES